MKKLTFIFSIIAMILVLGGCAQMKAAMARAEAQERAREAAAAKAAAERAKKEKEIHCSHNGAYANGMNDARHGRDMQSSYAAECQQENQHMLNKTYRQGYEAGAKSAPIQPKPKPKPQPTWHCVRDGYGKDVCGYECVSSFGKVACSQHRWENCVKNNYGDIQCGYHCADDGYGKINCQKTDQSGRTSQADIDKANARTKKIIHNAKEGTKKVIHKIFG